MTALISVALLGYPILALVFFSVLPPRRALALYMVIGWLFLPAVEIPVQGFVNFDRSVSTSIGALLATTLLDGARPFQLRPRLLDLPMALWCTAPLLSSLSNDLGFYDGASESLNTTLIWGVPWILGRTYFADPDGMRVLARTIFLGGLIYAPLCMWEVRMSPSLHYNVYGYAVYRGVMAYAADLGNWGSRPSVFFNGPLSVGMFMTSAGLCGAAVCTIRKDRRLFGVKTARLVVFLVFVAVLCKNLGATTLLLSGIGMLRLMRKRKSALLLWLITLVPVAYVAVRSTGTWDGSEVTEAAGMIHPDRAISFSFRIMMENILVEKALQRPVFGWGGWGRSRVFNDMGEDVVIADGMWVIALGETGLWGLTMLILTLLLPVVSIILRFDRRYWPLEWASPILAMTILLATWSVDNLVNGFPNSLVLLGAGAIAGIPGYRATSVRGRRAHPEPRPAALSTGRMDSLLRRSQHRAGN